MVRPARVRGDGEEKLDPLEQDDREEGKIRRDGRLIGNTAQGDQQDGKQSQRAELNRFGKQLGGT